MLEQTLWFAAALGVLGLPAGRFLKAAAIRVLVKKTYVSPVPQRIHRNRHGTWLAPISAVVPAVLFAWVGLHFGPFDPEWIAGLLLVSVLVTITHTDLKAMIIPDAVVFTGLAIAAAVRLFVHPLPLWDYGLAAGIGFGLLYFMAYISRGGIGGGDMKLYLFIGAVCGLQATILSLFLASLLGTGYAIVRKLGGRLTPKQDIPFGPFISAGAFLSFLYGNHWLEAYISRLTY